ncbi:hypothetical protein NDI76_07160 [Halogeometricum sp. S1BR25-6]|uniref:Uncharacterized protein n=1 Tax=Halogeometricum salsisoli TaxID=2950536 RepID=A0ABU2GCH9_9EURY|nr:hypothetical protein [Halogeometricum sp. S1BR25-6]MDS0298515.1 hypothetical protein [Halogeometricum sp. S1BR25-6]
MATHASNGDGVALPDAVPLDVRCLTRLSWELGSRVVDDEESSRESEWTHVDAPWRLSVFHVTNHTDVLRVRTPVGRERFYGAVETDLREALPGLEASAQWRRCG